MDAKQEVWKDIPGYEGLYQVSDLGRVKSFKYYKEKICTLILSNKGYLRLGLRKDGIRKHYKVSQLVAMAFLGHIPNGHTTVVDHINEDKLDNRLENLQLISHRENICRVPKAKYSSKYKGVYWNKGCSKWLAHIRIDGLLVHLGCFENEEEAAQAYQDKLKEIIN